MKRPPYTLICFSLLLLALLPGCDSGAGETAPAAPTMLFPSNGATDTANAVDLLWNPVSGILSYHLQVSDSPDFTKNVLDRQDVRKNVAAATGLAVGTTYHWRVRAELPEGLSDWSATWQFTPSSIAVTPARPSLSYPDDGAVAQPTTIAFAWNASPGASSYQIQVSLEPDFIRRRADMEGVYETNQIVTGLVHTYTYYWRVRAANPIGISDWSPARQLLVADQ